MTNIDYSGNVNNVIENASYWRTPRMPYDFSSLSTDDVAQAKARVKKELERQLYEATLRLEQDPATYDYDSHVLPDDEFAPGYPIKLAISSFLSQIAFINNME